MRKSTCILALTLGLLTACNRPPGPDAVVCDGGPAPSQERASEVRAEDLRNAGSNKARRQTAEAAYADACLRRWAYRLSSSSAGVDEVGSAAMHRCRVELARWRDSAAALPGAPEAGEMSAEASRSANFYAVQAMAGQCAVEGDR